MIGALNLRRVHAAGMAVSVTWVSCCGSPHNQTPTIPGSILEPFFFFGNSQILHRFAMPGRLASSVVDPVHAEAKQVQVNLKKALSKTLLLGIDSSGTGDSLKPGI